MSKILITGVSSGIGRALTKKLVLQGHQVWGVARRESLLKGLRKELTYSSKFFFTALDMAEKGSWDTLMKKIIRKKFIPTIIIFNAAILEYDLEGGLSLVSTGKMFDVNFFSALKGIELLLKVVKKNTRFIAISSLSALKGNSIEGVGYSASKAALSVAFEAMHQKYKSKGLLFKTVYFGPVASGMGPFMAKFPVMQEERAVEGIMNAIQGNQILYYYPWYLFFIMKMIKLLPSNFYFIILSKMEQMHIKFKKKE